MSRSYKKIPISKDNGYAKYGKRFANKTVRRTTDLPLKGGYYKKLYESWNIHDYVVYWPLEEAIAKWNNPDWNSYLKEKYDTLEKFLSYWKKCMLRK